MVMLFRIDSNNGRNVNCKHAVWKQDALNLCFCRNIIKFNDLFVPVSHVITESKRCEEEK